MNHIKKILSLILICTMLFSMSVNFAFAAGNDPKISAESAIIVCGDSGDILWSKNADKQMEPASITKLLTCLIAVESLDLDKLVTITADIAAIPPMELGVFEGEEISVRDLVYGALLASGNDAATALAIEVAGSVEEFAVMMNQKAEELGCTNSNFVTPSGLSAENHYSCAADIAKITEAALSNEFIRKVSGTDKYTVPATNMSGARELTNSNVLLAGGEITLANGTTQEVAKYKGVFGGKTGSLNGDYTTLSVGLQHDGMEIYVVLLGDDSEHRFSDMKILLDYAKASISKYVVFEKGTEFDKVKLKGGATNKVMAIASKEGFVNLPEGASASLVITKCVYTDGLTAPIVKGQKIGVVEIYIADDLYTKVDLVAAENIEEGWFLSFLGITNFQTILLGVLLTLFIICALTILYLRAKNKKKMKALRKKRLMEEARKQLEREEDLKRRNWHF